jgi:hypothetical protein
MTMLRCGVIPNINAISLTASAIYPLGFMMRCGIIGYTVGIC